MCNLRNLPPWKTGWYTLRPVATESMTQPFSEIDHTPTANTWVVVIMGGLTALGCNVFPGNIINSLSCSRIPAAYFHGVLTQHVVGRSCSVTQGKKISVSEQVFSWTFGFQVRYFELNHSMENGASKLHTETFPSCWNYQTMVICRVNRGSLDTIIRTA